jgi:hypothetical protein
MRFHLPSFLMGCGVGFATRSLSTHFSPVLLEIATAGHRLAEAVASRAARAREDVEDVFAEARAQAAARRAKADTAPTH